ncbi:methyl-accepting chemotaxis protein [Alkalibacillus salilacus]|uniref:Methyl-accepting chemotaxis protein n=1 Tax=Alkalibacillus salilacus TaxID=284582 RepID=A0ABT9VG70_9BACI|nr:HAMP domain-containing methyl-accepting chemotaxis protein [Alkalibacillus salilacus]MDQ0159904.1 methyl-accepting chemotaxis protein [Alkalibacillus salilacus]
MGKLQKWRAKLPKRGSRRQKSKRETEENIHKTKVFSNLSIGKKYGLVLIFTLLLFTIASGFVFMQAYDSDQTINEQVGLSEAAIEVGEMESIFRGKDIRISDYVMLKTNDHINEYRSMNEEFVAIAENVGNRLGSEQQSLLDQILTNNEEITNIVEEEIVYAIGERDEQAALGGRSKVESIRTETTGMIDELRQMVINDFSASAGDTRSAMLEIQTVLVTGIIVAAVIAIILLVVISRNVNKNIQSVVEVADQISEGDLTVEDVQYQGNDELGRLASSINTMKSNLRTIISSVSTASESVTNKGEAMTASAREVSEGSEQIASTMQELSSGTETQAQSASALSEMMEQLVRKVQTSYDGGEHVSHASEEVLEMTQEGRSMMSESVTQMSQIHHIVEDAVEKVKGLDRQSNEISKLVQVIEDIADQTNLLALNAAIEAARAGEHGKGFAVVADEVRKLAEQVSHSVGDITGIVGSIQTESKQVTQSLESGYHEVEQGSEQIKHTEQTFIQIKEAINNVVSQIQEITSNLKDVLNDSQEMNKSVEEIASISEESAAGVEQTASSIEETNSSMEEISRAADDLTKLAEDLNSQVQQFKL